MPAQYEKMRDTFAAQGMDYDRAQAKAARIYNSKHPSRPITGREASSRAVDGLKRAKSKAY
jgi:hypothetical protein